MNPILKTISDLLANDKDLADDLLDCAKGVNYHGKRLDSVKIKTANEAFLASVLSAELDESLVYDSEDGEQVIKPEFTTALMVWLNENKPATKAKARKADNPDLPVYGGSLKPAQSKWQVKSGKAFILTTAQNNTSVNVPFLKSLETYAEYLGAELIISKFAYNKKGYANPTAQDDSLWYAPELAPYFVEENVFLGDSKKVSFLGALCISPTAINPLTGIESIIGNHHAVVPAAKYQMFNIPALKGELVRELTTTGTVTHRNYIQRLAGQKAESLHCYGAILVEFDDNDVPFIRHLQCMNDDGSFYDLDTYVTSEQVFRAENHVSALQFGDLHAEKIDHVVAACSWGNGLHGYPSMIDLLKPKFTICHDSHDFTSRNHHNRRDYDFIAERYYLGQESVKQDLIDTANIFRDIMRPFSEIIVVESNHDLALANWLKAWDVNIGLDPANAILYHEMNLDKYRHIAEHKSASGWNALEVGLKKIAKLENANQIRFLVVDESFKVSGVEMGCHGHVGANGSRGNPKQFAKLGRLNTGHTHSASVNGLCYTAGVAGSLDMGYNIGASSWTQTHLITFSNGQRQLVRITNGKYRA